MKKSIWGLLLVGWFTQVNGHGFDFYVSKVDAIRALQSEQERVAARKTLGGELAADINNLVVVEYLLRNLISDSIGYELKLDFVTKQDLVEGFLTRNSQKFVKAYSKKLMSIDFSLTEETQQIIGDRVRSLLKQEMDASDRLNGSVAVSSSALASPKPTIVDGRSSEDSDSDDRKSPELTPAKPNPAALALGAKGLRRAGLAPAQLAPVQPAESLGQAEKDTRNRINRQRVMHLKAAIPIDDRVWETKVNGIVLISEDQLVENVEKKNGVWTYVEPEDGPDDDGLDDDED